MSEEQEQYICDLEEDIKNIEVMYGALKAIHSALQSENKRQREALEKIAALENDKRAKGIGYDDEIYQIAKLFLNKP